MQRNREKPKRAIVLSLMLLGLAPASTPAQDGSCSETPAQTEGPYYLDLGLERSDITEGKPGVPLALRIRVVDPATCSPVQGRRVEIWHPDALGVYSGIPSQGTAGETYLRGSQITNPEGVVEFRTIYPGWYPGRAVHIHVKVQTQSGSTLTSQIYFDDALSDQVFDLEPYSSRTGSRTLNENDGIFSGTANPPIAEASITDGKAIAEVRLAA